MIPQSKGSGTSFLIVDSQAPISNNSNGVSKPIVFPKNLPNFKRKALSENRSKNILIENIFINRSGCADEPEATKYKNARKLRTTKRVAAFVTRHNLAENISMGIQRELSLPIQKRKPTMPDNVKLHERKQQGEIMDCRKKTNAKKQKKNNNNKSNFTLEDEQIDVTMGRNIV